jgi:hypothetical protein
MVRHPAHLGWRRSGRNRSVSRIGCVAGGQMRAMVRLTMAASFPSDCRMVASEMIPASRHGALGSHPTPAGMPRRPTFMVPPSVQRQNALCNLLVSLTIRRSGRFRWWAPLLPTMRLLGSDIREWLWRPDRCRNQLDQQLGPIVSRRANAPIDWPGAQQTVGRRRRATPRQHCGGGRLDPSKRCAGRRRGCGGCVLAGVRQVHVALREPRAHIPASSDTVRSSRFDRAIGGRPT